MATPEAEAKESDADRVHEHRVARSPRQPSRGHARPVHRGIVADGHEQERGDDGEHRHDEVRRPVRGERAGVRERPRDELRRAGAERPEREGQAPERLAQGEDAGARGVARAVGEKRVERCDGEGAGRAVRQADAAQSAREDEPGHVGRRREDEVARDRQDRPGDEEAASPKAVRQDARERHEQGGHRAGGRVQGADERRLQAGTRQVERKHDQEVAGGDGAEEHRGEEQPRRARRVVGGQLAHEEAERTSRTRLSALRTTYTRRYPRPTKTL